MPCIVNGSWYPHILDMGGVTNSLNSEWRSHEEKAQAILGYWIPARGKQEKFAWVLTYELKVQLSRFAQLQNGETQSRSGTNDKELLVIGLYLQKCTGQKLSSREMTGEYKLSYPFIIQHALLWRVWWGEKLKQRQQLDSMNVTLSQSSRWTFITSSKAISYIQVDITNANALSNYNQNYWPDVCICNHPLSNSCIVLFGRQHDHIPCDRVLVARASRFAFMLDGVPLEIRPQSDGDDERTLFLRRFFAQHLSWFRKLDNVFNFLLTFVIHSVLNARVGHHLVDGRLE